MDDSKKMVKPDRVDLDALRDGGAVVRATSKCRLLFTCAFDKPSDALAVASGLFAREFPAPDDSTELDF